MPSADAKPARAAPDLAIPLEEAIRSTSAEVLKAAAADPALTEDLALALVKRADVPADALELLGKNGTAMKSRKVKRALVEHPRTPRHVSLPLVRHLFIFDLMRVALTPVVPADIKRAADEALINRLETISTGERLSLAHRGSARIAGALLLDPEARVIRATLENPRLIEAAIIQALTRHDAPSAFVEGVCRHPKWSVRREVRIALLRNEHTPLARALEFAQALPAPLVREVLHGSRLPGNIKAYALKELGQRDSSTRKRRQR